MTTIWLPADLSTARRHDAARSMVPDRVLSCQVLARHGSHRVGERYLGRDVHSDEPRLLYRVPAPRHSRGDVLRPPTLPRACGLPHVVGVLDSDADMHGELWIVAEFAGVGDAVMTIPQVLASRPGGQMKPCEARRVVLQAAQGLMSAERAGTPHGPVRADELLLDRVGHVRVELPGVARALCEWAPWIGASETALDPVSSLGRLMYRLVSGAEPSDWENPTPIHQFAPGITRAWRGWFERTLARKPGFVGVEECVRACPDSAGR